MEKTSAPQKSCDFKRILLQILRMHLPITVLLILVNRRKSIRLKMTLAHHKPFQQ